MTARSFKLIALFSALAFGGSAFAGVSVNPVIWGPATTISGDSNVSTTGSLVAAFNMNGNSTTVNGVTFAAFAVPFGTTTTNGNFSFGETPGQLVAPSTLGSASAPFSSLSANYQTILTTAISSSDNNTLFLTMSNLTNGLTYQFEFWTNASSHVGGGSGYATTGSSGARVSLDDNTTDVQGGVGQFAIGTFVATNFTQQISFTGTTSTQAPTINAFELRIIPEPASFGLALIGAGILIASRRLKIAC